MVKMNAYIYIYIKFDIIRLAVDGQDTGRVDNYIKVPETSQNRPQYRGWTVDGCFKRPFGHRNRYPIIFQACLSVQLLG